MAKRKERAVDDLLPDERCPQHIVDTLVSQGFKREAVEKWTAVKGRAILDKYQREVTNAVSKADGVAQRNDSTTYPPPQPERDDAAGWIAAALGKSCRWELILAVCNGIWQLADDELHRLASYLIQRLKVVPQLPEVASLFGRVKPVPARVADEEGGGGDTGGFDL